MNKKIRIMVVDDHFVVRIGLASSIDLESDMVVEAEAASGSQAIEQFRKFKPDIVLMDLKLPDMSGIEATANICKEFPGAVIMVAFHLTTGRPHWEWIVSGYGQREKIARREPEWDGKTRSIQHA